MLKVLKYNKNKVGVYRRVNKINGNTYIGSSVRVYYKGKSRIYSAILKYGYSNFLLEILEYCTKENAINREQKMGISAQKHTEETKKLISLATKIGKRHSEQTKALIT